jgi:Sperm-tail PG-rich repeat
MKKSSPAWTLRGRKSEPKVITVPGPGYYNPSDFNLESSPKHVIGKSSRILKSNFTNPGPGAYSPKDHLKLSPRPM